MRAVSRNVETGFEKALSRFRSARQAVEGLGSGSDERDRALMSADIALDAFMAQPSPSLGAFGAKIRILEEEYGLDAQPRHIGAIYADVESLTPH